MSDDIPDPVADLLAAAGLPADYGRRCDHGRLARTCETCELEEAYTRIAALEAELAREQEIYQELSAALADANDDADRAEARVAALIDAGDRSIGHRCECEPGVYPDHAGHAKNCAVGDWLEASNDH